MAVEVCAKDPNVQGLLVLLTPQAMTDPTETARRSAPFAKRRASRCWPAGWAARGCVPAGASSSTAGIPTFDSPEAAIRAFLHMVQYRRNQELLYERPEALPEDWQPDTDRGAATDPAQRAVGERTLLTEAEAKEVLAAYGMPVAASMPCQTMRSGRAGGGQDRLSGGAEAALVRSRTRATSAACSSTCRRTGGAVRLRGDPRQSARRRKPAARLRGRHGSADGPRQGLRADRRQFGRSPVRPGASCSARAACWSRCSRIAPWPCRRSIAPWPAG